MVADIQKKLKKFFFQFPEFFLLLSKFGRFSGHSGLLLKKNRQSCRCPHIEIEVPRESIHFILKISPKTAKPTKKKSQNASDFYILNLI